MGSATWLMSSSLVMHRPVVSLASFFVDTFGDAGVEGVVEPEFDFGADDGLDGKPEVGPAAGAEDDVDAVAEAALCELFDGFR